MSGTKPFSWDDVFDEIAAENAATFDAAQTPERLAAAKAKRDREHDTGVNLGWWTEDGTPIPQPEDDDPDEDEGCDA